MKMKDNNCNKKSKFFKLGNLHLWLFPVLAIIFSTWAVTKYFEKSGKEIEISFTDANSIVPEKTRVLYRGVQIGIVEEVTISDDMKKVVCTVKLTKTGEKFAVAGTKFYLITPKVGLDQISGLDTIISGSYITTEPNFASKDEEKKFEGFTSNPNAQDSSTKETMAEYFLFTDHAESVSAGDNIYFRGLIVGQVGVIDLTPDSRKVSVGILIQKQYSKLIRTNTVFWKKQGIKADLGLFGSDIRVNSLDTIMKGGIELATPNKAGPMANAKTKFTLLDNEPEEREDNKWNPELKFPKKQHKRLAIINN